MSGAAVVRNQKRRKGSKMKTISETERGILNQEFSDHYTRGHAWPGLARCRCFHHR